MTVTPERTDSHTEPANLIHLIYCSAARRRFTREELLNLLEKARHHNTQCGVTGMLLYVDGSFFQVLEGDAETVDALFDDIRRDGRHERITLIIREPIHERAFADWTMGFADMTPDQLEEIVGINTFFHSDYSHQALGTSRALKLLTSFREGRWRTALSGPAPESQTVPPSPPIGQLTSHAPEYTFAFQPIVQASARMIFSYEALVRGTANESAAIVLHRIPASNRHIFHEQCRVSALELAAQLGLATRINLNFLPSSIDVSDTAVSSIIETASRCHIRPDQIVLEILESDIIHDIEHFSATLSQYRRAGVTLAIDDFGAGYAGLNLLADFQPDLIKLDMCLIRGIDGNGPRQAIVRGILRTCRDLGIDVIAEGVETQGEFAWLQQEGIDLFQGYLLARPAFEQLAPTFFLPG